MVGSGAMSKNAEQSVSIAIKETPAGHGVLNVLKRLFELASFSPDAKSFTGSP